MKKTTVNGLILAILIAAGSPALAEPDIERGKELFALCSACHGANGEGIQALNSPANAGQDLWYMIRQLKNYKRGIRGANPDDIYGAQMRPMAMQLVDDQAIEDVSAYITTLALPKPESSVEGDVEAGKKAFTTCVPCHGEYGEGAKALDAPRLSKQFDWYIVRQLENYRKGVRGTHQNDIYGQQMRLMSQMLETDERIRDVAAYIATLDYIPGGE